MAEIEEPGTIRDGEYHPAADSAMSYVKFIMAEDPVLWMQLRESFSSVAISGNRLAEICSATIDRLEKGLPVSDRYLLGLAWTLKTMEQQKRIEL